MMRLFTTLQRTAAATALALPLTVVAVAPPAVALAAAPPLTPSGEGYHHGGPGAWAAGSTAALDTTDATDAQSTGLVAITTTLYYGEGEAAGTGIVLDGDGLVVTNHHVVEGATSVTVTVPATGEEYDADVLGHDARRDVAVLQLEDATGLDTVTTDTTALAVGDAVTAVGDAGGDGGSLAAAPGTVTDLRHSITVTDEETGEGTPLARLVEVSSDIVPGDSGGALLATDGDVVGMNVAASSGGADVTGYVIPVARVLRVVDRVLDGEDAGSVTIGDTAFLGVSLADDSTVLSGVLDDGPAADAGLTAGDTVTSVGGTTVDTADDLRAAIAALAPGDRAEVTWTGTGGRNRTATTTLGAGPVG